MEANAAIKDLREIIGLVQQLMGLNTTLRWFIGLLAGAFVNFFFAVVQGGLI